MVAVAFGGAVLCFSGGIWLISSVCPYNAPGREGRSVIIRAFTPWALCLDAVIVYDVLAGGFERRPSCAANRRVPGPAPLVSSFRDHWAGDF